MATLEYCLVIIQLLLSFQVDGILATVSCYNNNGYYTGYCNDDQYCCNSGYSCCEDDDFYITGGAIAGIVIGVIFVLAVIFICVRLVYVKKVRKTPVAAAPATTVTTVHRTNGNMYPQPPMGGPNPPMGGPNPHMGGQYPPIGGPNPPPYAADPVYPPPAYY